MHEARTQIPPTAPERIIPLVEDDTEEAPWMVMGDPQFWAASHLAHCLDTYAQNHGLPWYVASMLPILYRRPGEKRTRQVAPDVLVALVPRHRRESYDLDTEGAFPAFVLEVLSSTSVTRDRDKKRRLYEALGAQEYVLFAPQPGLQTPPLQGYRRGPMGRFDRWSPDPDGGLRSVVLGLRLMPEGGLVRAQDEHGQPLLTLPEAEEELARLRALLKRLEGEHSNRIDDTNKGDDANS